MANNQEIIDLTQPFVYCRAPITLFDSVIELDDSIGPDAVTAPTPERSVHLAESIVVEGETDMLPAVNVSLESQSKKSIASKKKKRSSTTVEASSNREKVPRLGDCPICRDPLGNRPMASTKCGHVYCTVCVEQAVKIEKKCPTCRKQLKGPNAFHPLYL